MARCAACGEENPDRARFCLGCGRALSVAPARPETRKTVDEMFRGVPDAERLKMTAGNAIKLYKLG